MYHTPHIIKNTSTIDFITNPTNAILVIWSFTLYIVLFLLLKHVQGKTKNLNIPGIIDATMLFLLFSVLLVAYFLVPENKKYDTATSLTNSLFSFLNHSFSLLPVTLIMIVFYSIMYTFHKYSLNQSNALVLFEIVLWFLFTLLLIVNFFKFVLLIDVIPFSHKFFAKT